jgi:hypothetical protein
MAVERAREWGPPYSSYTSYSAGWV